MSDIFAEYLERNKKNTNCRALTCKSYGKVYQHVHKKPLDPQKTNTELATYGDALLKFILCEMFLDKCKSLSKHIEQYETDEFLIETVAQHYSILDYINYDDIDTEIVKDYKFLKNGNSKESKTKYIATAVEAVLGALYKYDHKSLKQIYDLVENWTKLQSKTPSQG